MGIGDISKKAKIGIGVAIGVIAAITITIVLVVLLYAGGSSAKAPQTTQTPQPHELLPEPNFELTSLVNSPANVVDLGINVVYNSTTRNGFLVALQANFVQLVRYIGFFFYVTNNDKVVLSEQFKPEQAGDFINDIHVVVSNFPGTNYMLVYQTTIVDQNFKYEVFTYEYKGNNKWEEISKQEFSSGAVPQDMWTNGTDIFCIFTNAVIYKWNTGKSEWEVFQTITVENATALRVAKFAQASGELFFMRTTPQNAIFVDNYVYVSGGSKKWLKSTVNANLSGLSGTLVQAMSLDVEPHGFRILVVVNYGSNHAPRQVFFIHDSTLAGVYFAPAACTRSGEYQTTCCLGSALPELNMWVTSHSPVDSRGTIGSGNYLVFRNDHDPYAIITDNENPLKGDPATFPHSYEILHTSVQTNFKPQISWASQNSIYLFLSNNNRLELWKMVVDF